MFLVDPKVFRFVVKGVKAIFWGVQRGWWLLLNPMGNLKFRTLMLITSNWIMIETYNLTSDRSPLEEQFCIFKMSAIFKMAAKTRHKNGG